MEQRAARRRSVPDAWQIAHVARCCCRWILRSRMPRRAAVGLTAAGGWLREGDWGTRTPSPLRTDAGNMFGDFARPNVLEDVDGAEEHQELGVWVNGPADVRLVSFTPLTLSTRTGKRLRSCSGQAAGNGAHRLVIALL